MASRESAPQPQGTRTPGALVPLLNFYAVRENGELSMTLTNEYRSDWKLYERVQHPPGSGVYLCRVRTLVGSPKSDLLYLGAAESRGLNDLDRLDVTGRIDFDSSLAYVQWLWGHLYTKNIIFKDDYIQGKEMLKEFPVSKNK